MAFCIRLVNYRNHIFFAVLGLSIILIGFSCQQSMVQKEMFLKDRELFAASIAAYLKNDYQGALDYLQQSSTVFQQDWNCYYLLGTINMQMGNYSVANECFQQTEDRAPMVLSMNEFLIKRGELYVLMGRKNDSLDYLNHAYSKSSTIEERQIIESLIQDAESLE